MDLLTVLAALAGETIEGSEADCYEAENDAAKNIRLKLASGKVIEFSAETFVGGDPYDHGSSYSKMQADFVS